MEATDKGAGYLVYGTIVTCTLSLQVIDKHKKKKRMVCYKNLRIFSGILKTILQNPSDLKRKGKSSMQKWNCLEIASVPCI